MPIWIKIIFFCWFGLTPVGFVMFRIWSDNHPFEVRTQKYPGWVLGFAILFLFDIFMVLPVVFWFVFLR